MGMRTKKIWNSLSSYKFIPHPTFIGHKKLTQHVKIVILIKIVT